MIGVAAPPAELHRRAERAVRAARRAGAPVLLAHTSRVAADIDPSAVVAASRREGEHWFCFEQPDRSRAAVACLGSVVRLQASGPDRFSVVAREWRSLAGDAVADPCDGPPGAGLVAVGGIAFARISHGIARERAPLARVDR